MKCHAAINECACGYDATSAHFAFGGRYINIHFFLSNISIIATTTLLEMAGIVNYYTTGITKHCVSVSQQQLHWHWFWCHADSVIIGIDLWLSNRWNHWCWWWHGQSSAIQEQKQEKCSSESNEERNTIQWIGCPAIVIVAMIWQCQWHVGWKVAPPVTPIAIAIVVNYCGDNDTWGDGKRRESPCPCPCQQFVLERYNLF